MRITLTKGFTGTQITKAVLVFVTVIVAAALSNEYRNRMVNLLVCKCHRRVVKLII